jgi:hypothetical protein
MRYPASIGMVKYTSNRSQRLPSRCKLILTSKVHKRHLNFTTTSLYSCLGHRARFLPQVALLQLLPILKRSHPGLIDSGRSLPMRAPPKSDQIRAEHRRHLQNLLQGRDRIRSGGHQLPQNGVRFTSRQEPRYHLKVIPFLHLRVLPRRLFGYEQTSQEIQSERHPPYVDSPDPYPCSINISLSN